MGNNKSSCNNAKALRVTHEDQISNEPPNPSAPSALVETSFDLSPDVSDDDGYVLEEDEIMLNLSSSESESDSDSEEENDDDVFAQFRQDRAEALAAVREMKEVVAWFHHPSAPIKVTAPPARCFFERASVVLTCLNETDATAPKGVIDVEGAEEQEERREALAAAAKMRETVSWYTNPSQPLKVSPFAIASAASTVPTFLNEVDSTAPKGIVDVDGADEQEERRQILATAAEMKKIASWYLHPSQPLETSPMASARCYFDRASAVEQETKENADDRAEALEAAKEMSKVVSWFTNPSQPVEVSPMASAHCTFSDKDMNSKEEADERAEILEDCKQLSKVASWFSNPSQPIEVSPFASAKCAFSNARETKEKADARAEAIEAVKEISKITSWFTNPSQPVEVSATASARNFFTRSTAKQTSEPIRTIRTRGESAMDMFDMDMEDSNSSFVSGLSIDTDQGQEKNLAVEEDHGVEGSDKEGNLSRSPSSVALFGLGDEIC
ncbi:hypothetical protein TrLO_g9665 [Triparma laevis f. longispina]|uniref:Uncharacterized protein n=1 Tax=Triparma laevis f. longispina TaxID=1714387 RepID=A0A9W7CER1_9STRA|nr:hypothetical protein TrLO_g9665 [Triparma laevis f. longispina]